MRNTIRLYYRLTWTFPRSKPLRVITDALGLEQFANGAPEDARRDGLTYFHVETITEAEALRERDEVQR